MSHRNNLTAPSKPKRTTEDEISIPISTDTTATSSPKRRKVESTTISPQRRSSVSPLKPEPKREDDLRRYGSSTTTCSEEEASDGCVLKSTDPTNCSFIKKSDYTDRNSNNNDSVVSSPESEVCAEKEDIMESKGEANRQGGRSIVFKTPTDKEIEDFFLAAEMAQAQRFKEKYNFDIVNDLPVKGGRFEWSPIKH